jgi:hypothetical protein
MGGDGDAEGMSFPNEPRANRRQLLDVTGGRCICAKNHIWLGGKLLHIVSGVRGTSFWRTLSAPEPPLCWLLWFKFLSLSRPWWIQTSLQVF